MESFSVSRRLVKVSPCESCHSPIVVHVASISHPRQSSACASAAAPPASTPEVPDWALPGSPTHVQVPPPADFHRPTRNFDTPIGIFDGQSDIGGPFVPGSASYDAATGQYTINSAGYNIWYFRDEFRYLWKKMSGDVSFAADVTFPNPNGFGDRKVVLVIRQNLDDDSKEAMVGEHGAGMIHLAFRSDKAAFMKDLEYRFTGVSHRRPCQTRRNRKAWRLLRHLRQPAGRAHAPVWAADHPAFRRAVLRRHRLLLASARHIRYGRRLQRSPGERRRQGAIALHRPIPLTFLHAGSCAATFSDPSPAAC